ncbi:ABC transporter ATP-binding protein [Thermobrachium celere]|uniref:ABC-type quaternary amine transporter n=1 Tax=Thermobrachium celere DSM 8682 TaxID=941824 RepID=R7RSU2_9CLOT|nr:ABC transporter ATP-binding protein [Thermobrachium celere]CDF59272.1 putative iron ABC transporter, ATP-binding protein [Thermobrachium celere DSM 8682]
MYVIVKNLSFKYKNAKDYQITNFNLEIEKGEIVALLGPSGSGKSTILRLISGLEIPNGGEIIVNNRVLYNKNVFIEPQKRGIGMVFQDYALFPHMTVEKNILFGLEKINKEARQRILDEVLELVDMKEYKKRYPHELSGGQQQRIAIARALAPKPSLLLLDEPFSNLDAGLKKRIRKEIKEILKKSNITSIFVTHDIEDAKDVADRIECHPCEM